LIREQNVGDNVVAGFDLLASQTSSATGVDRIVLRLKFASDASSIGQPASRQQADFAPRSSPIDFGSSSFSRSQTAPRSRSLATGLPGSSRSPVEPVNGFWEQQSLPKLRISPGLATHEAMPWCIHRTDSQSRWRANHGRAKSKNVGGNRGLGFELEVQSGSGTNPAVHRLVPNANGTKRVGSESNPPTDTQDNTNQVSTASGFTATDDPVRLLATLPSIRVCPHASVVCLEA
jgi:hypothetical protein